MPDWKKEIRESLAGLRLAPTRETEIVEELAQDLEDCYQELLASGATKEEAWRTTMEELNESDVLARELNKIEQPVNEEPVVLGATGAGRISMLRDLLRDLSFGIRILLKSKGFTIVTVLSLALGIGANTAIFSVINTLVLNPLPYKDPARLMVVWETNRHLGPEMWDRNEVAIGNFLDWRSRNQVFDQLGLFSISTVTGKFHEPRRAHCFGCSEYDPSIRNQVFSIDKDQPVFDIMTMEQRLAKSVASSRFVMLLLGTFSILALGLAAVGIYGVMAYLVSQRTQEIGVRMALGAQKRDVLKLVVGKGMALAVIGTAIGLVASLALTRLMRSLLFEVTPNDWLTFVIVSVALLTVALLACYIPARRATKVDPLIALRYE